MKIFKITRNGKDLKTGLTKEQALEQLFPLVEDFSNGYIFDPDNKTIYNEVDHKVYAKEGDEIVIAGDDVFEIEEDNNHE